jgi:hypothetical protein
MFYEKSANALCDLMLSRLHGKSYMRSQFIDGAKVLRELLISVIPLSLALSVPQQHAFLCVSSVIPSMDSQQQLTGILGAQSNIRASL